MPNSLTEHTKKTARFSQSLYDPASLVRIQNYMEEFSRQKWIEACEFHDLGEKAILEEVASRIRAAVNARTLPPTVVFDLDSTLYEVAPRTHAIIREWLATGHTLPPHIMTVLNRLKHEDICYSLKDTFESIGLDLTDLSVIKTWKILKDFWWERFFSSAYLKFDTPYPGAPTFVRHVYQLGAQIIYLTGRDQKKMLKGSIANLKRDQFPLDMESAPPRVRLVMKNDSLLSDSDFKRGAASELEKTCHVVASFENEPHNVVALYETFPNALHIVLQTTCSAKPARALSGLYKIRGFAPEDEA